MPPKPKVNWYSANFFSVPIGFCRALIHAHSLIDRRSQLSFLLMSSSSKSSLLMSSSSSSSMSLLSPTSSPHLSHLVIVCSFLAIVSERFRSFKITDLVATPSPIDRSLLFIYSTSEKNLTDSDCFNVAQCVSREWQRKKSLSKLA